MTPLVLPTRPCPSPQLADARRCSLSYLQVYQENVYGDAPKFTSFKRALAELRARGEAGDESAATLASQAQLISFHSTSKGFFGECGLRGGYFEVQNLPSDVRAQITKLASISLCAREVSVVSGLGARAW